jgi:hypothetical protein
VRRLKTDIDFKPRFGSVPKRGFQRLQGFLVPAAAHLVFCRFQKIDQLIILHMIPENNFTLNLDIS